MVEGLDTFQKYFADYEEQYVLIGGAACDILFESNEVNFRATRDLDMVLIVEALTPEFGEKFWEFIADYYKALLDGKEVRKGLSVLRPEYIILFKAKAYLDLQKRKDLGEKVDSSDIKKHKKDVLRIASELMLEKVEELPIAVDVDIHSFIDLLEQEPFDQNSLKRYGLKNEDIVELLKQVFG